MGAIRPQFETHSKYSRVNDEEKKSLRRNLHYFFWEALIRKSYLKLFKFFPNNIFWNIKSINEQN